MEAPVPSTTAKIHMQTYYRTAITTAQYSPKVWERLADHVCSTPKRRKLENVFFHIDNLLQNSNFTTKKKSNGWLEFLNTLLKQNSGKLYVLV